jgi:hypothetical protein
MLSQVEAHRLAAAVNHLRPDWPLASLSTWIRNHLTDRAYRDAAVALTWVACDAETKSPGRVLEDGPWWRATQAGAGTVSAIPTRCPEHPTSPAWQCPECESDAVPADAVPALVRRVRAQIAPTPPRRPDHDPNPARDLALARARADRANAKEEQR